MISDLDVLWSCCDHAESAVLLRESFKSNASGLQDVLILHLGYIVVILSGSRRSQTSICHLGPLLPPVRSRVPPRHCSFYFAYVWVLPPTAGVALMEYSSFPHYFIPPLTFQSLFFYAHKPQRSIGLAFLRHTPRDFSYPRNCVCECVCACLCVPRMRECARVWLKWPSTLFFYSASGRYNTRERCVVYERPNSQRRRWPAYELKPGG